jgi:hypothetical protein
MADFWDWIVPNVAGETNAKVADARKQYTGANGRLDPNAISAETLSNYGVPSQVTEDASPYLSTYKMSNDISKSALTPPEESWNQTLGRWMQVPAMGLMMHEGNGGAASRLLSDNLNTQSLDRQNKYQDAQRESVLKNAQNLTGNVDQIIAEQQKIRAGSRARKDTMAARENEAARYGLKQGTPEFNRYVLEGKYEPQYGATDDLKEYNAATQQGYKGSITDFLQMKKSTTGGPSPYVQNPDGTATFRPGGPADPATVSKLSEARGRGGAGVPVAVRTAGIQADQAYQAIIPLLDQYEQSITGGADPSKGTGAIMPWDVTDQDKVSQQRRNIQLQLKELYNLGVLNGPDLALMNQMLFDPNVSFNPLGDSEDGAKFKNMFNTGERAKQSVARLKETLRGIRNSKTKVLGMDDIGADGRPIPGSGGRTSVNPAVGEGTSVEPGVTDFSAMTNEQLLEELEGRGVSQ